MTPVPSAEIDPAERIVAAIRLGIVGLFVLGELVPHPDHDVAVLIPVLVVYGASALVPPALARRGEVPSWLPAAEVAWDVAAITALTALSGGPFSYARNAYFLIPVVVAFRHRPPATAVAGGIATIAYVVQALLHPDGDQDDAKGLIPMHAAYLVAVTTACTALSAVLERRTTRVARLAAERTQLVGDALDAAERERRLVADAIHDEVVQLVLAARHDVQGAREADPDPRLARAEQALDRSTVELRRALRELDPYTVGEGGLGTAVELVVEQARDRAGFQSDVDVDDDVPAEHHPLLYGLVRELVGNVVKHAHANRVIVRVGLDRDAVVLLVRDDGVGLGTTDLEERHSAGHIGLASQRARVEAAGGTFAVTEAPGEGVAVMVRLPRVAR